MRRLIFTKANALQAWTCLEWLLQKLGFAGSAQVENQVLMREIFLGGGLRGVEIFHVLQEVGLGILLLDHQWVMGRTDLDDDFVMLLGLGLDGAAAGIASKVHHEDHPLAGMTDYKI